MSKLHCMIDIETWGRKANATIISIGAVKFDPLDPTGPFDNFHVCIDPRASHESFAKLFEIDPDTVMWWMDPAQDQARAHWLKSTKLDLATVLTGFAEWFGPESLPTWGNGATFDNVIVTRSFELAGMQRPWAFWDDRCYRTLKNLCPGLQAPTPREMRLFYERDGVPAEEQGVAHTALFDAQRQAIHLRLLLEELGGAPRVPAPVHRSNGMRFEVSEPEPDRIRIEAFDDDPVDVSGTRRSEVLPETAQEEMTRLMSADLPPDQREAHAPDALHMPEVAEFTDPEMRRYHGLSEPRSGDMTDLVDRVTAGAPLPMDSLEAWTHGNGDVS